MKYDIFCINLKTRPDRLNNIKKIFYKLGILDKVNFHIVENHCKGPRFGCFNSHIECLEMSKGDYTIIFEDDCIENVKFKWETMINIIEKHFQNEKYGYFSIGNNLLLMTYKMIDNENNVIENNFSYCLAYAIKKSCYEKLKEKMNFYIDYIHIDFFLAFHLKNKIGFNTPYFKQNLFNTNNKWAPNNTLDYILRLCVLLGEKNIIMKLIIHILTVIIGYYVELSIYIYEILKLKK